MKAIKGAKMPYKTPESYLPHSGAMVLIDEIIEVGEDFIITKSIVKNHTEFCECVDSGDFGANLALPTYKSIELMAQSLGIFRALNESGSGSKLGFLLGARRFKILRPYIANWAIIKVTLSMQDNSGMGVYDCEVFENDTLIATASISALNPNDDFLSQIKGMQNE